MGVVGGYALRGDRMSRLASGGSYAPRRMVDGTYELTLVQPNGDVATVEFTLAEWLALQEEMEALTDES